MVIAIVLGGAVYYFVESKERLQTVANIENVHISVVGEHNSRLKVDYSFNGQDKEYVGNVYDCDGVIDSDEYIKKIDFNKDGADELFIACGKGAASLGYHVLGVDKEGNLRPIALGDMTTLASDAGYELKDLNNDGYQDISISSKDDEQINLTFNLDSNSFVKSENSSL